MQLNGEKRGRVRNRKRSRKGGDNLFIKKQSELLIKPKHIYKLKEIIKNSLSQNIQNYFPTSDLIKSEFKFLDLLMTTYY